MIRAMGNDRFFEITEPATMILANGREAEQLTGVRGEDAADVLASRFPIACVKLGEDGAVVSWEGLVIRMSPDPVEEKDPTGAGDAFNGVLLAALARGRSPGDALAAACRAGARVAMSFETWPERSGP